jgi:energy-coupling factor transport system ATP-binding protein
MLYVTGEGAVLDGSPPEVLRTIAIAPPIVELGRYAGWDPLPMTVRDARRMATTLRASLPDDAGRTRRHHHVDAATPLLTSTGVVVRYGPKVAVRAVNLDLFAGEVLAMMGRNGSGKSSLLWALQGSGPRHGGSVRVAGVDPATLPSAEARTHVGLVPQTASDLLYLETVAAECAEADAESRAEPGACRALLDRLAPGVPDDVHPRDLSEGQKLALVLAVQLTAAPDVVLLDEPTRGLDYLAKAALARTIASLAAEGRAIVVATHDVEFVATIADRVVVMAEGEIIAEGPAVDVLGGSPAFAPQVAKILGPQWLTPADVEAALAVAP